MKDYELRIIPGCPNTEAALNLFRRTLETEGTPDSNLHVRVIPTEDDARQLNFHGSPTFMANGRDLFPADADPALSCRIYPTEQGMAGLPDFESLRAAVRGGQ